MLILLCVHVTSVLFLVLAGNSTLTMGFFYWSYTRSYSSRPFLCALVDVTQVTHCAGCISASTRPHQLCWGDKEMGTAIICTWNVTIRNRIHTVCH